MRTGLAAAAAAAMAALAGCGSKDCPSLTPNLSNLPASCAYAPGAPVSVAIGVCPTCTQSDATCTPVLDNLATDKVIQLDPVVKMCEPDNSCPLPPTCGLVSCSFDAPASAGSYSLLVVDQAGTQHSIPFSVQPGNPNSCG